MLCNFFYILQFEADVVFINFTKFLNVIYIDKVLRTVLVPFLEFILLNFLSGTVD